MYRLTPWWLCFRRPKGHLFSNAKRLIGIEINPFWVDIQRRVVDEFELGDRVEVRVTFTT